MTLRPEPGALTPSQMTAGQNRIIFCSVISMLFWAGLNERVVSLLLLRLNPAVTDSTLAFFFALGPATTVLTALTSPAVDLYGKKRIMVPFYLAGAVFLALLIGAPLTRGWWGPTGAVAAMAVLLAGYASLRSLGFSGWFPLVNDNVPDESRGRFFGRLRTSWQIMLILCTIGVGTFLGQHPAVWRFQVLFAVALAANLVMTVGMMAIPEAPVSVQSEVRRFWQRLSVPFRDKVFVNFLVFGALYNLAAGLVGPFGIRCLKGTLGAGDNVVVWMDTLSSIGAALTLPLWGRFADRLGSRALFAVLLPPLALVNLLWLWVTPSGGAWPYVVGAYSVLHGICLFGVGVGITDLMLGSARTGSRSAYINIAFVANALAAGAAPFLGSFVARATAGWHGQWGPLTLDATRWVFLARVPLMLLPLLVVARLSRRHGGHVGEALQRLSATMMGLWPFARKG